MHWNTIKDLTFSLKGAVLLPAALVLVMMMATSLVAKQDCDCSCSAYAEMVALTEQARTAVQSGNLDKMPDEMRMEEFGRCASECASSWAQCDSPEAAATMQGQKSANAAQKRSAHEEARTNPGLPKDDLTAEYLTGMWCSVYGGREKAQWRFDSRGSYQIGLPAGSGYAMQGNPKSLEQFRARFDRLIERRTDTFTTEHLFGRNERMSRKNVFTRGPCK